MKITKKILTDYLLGKLAPEVQDEIETLYFSDDEVFGQVLTIYDELLKKYNKQQLSQDDRVLFAERYRHTVTGRQRIEFERELNAAIYSSVENTSFCRELVCHLENIVDRLRVKTSVPVLRLASYGAIAAILIIAINLLFFQPTLLQTSLIADIDFIYWQASPDAGGLGTQVRTRSMALATQKETDLILMDRDRYALKIRPQSEIYLYVFQWDTSGNIAVIFPSNDHVDSSNPLSADTTYRLPSPGRWFILDDNPGVEVIGIAAAKKPWELLDNYVAKILRGQSGERQALATEVKDLITKAEDTPDRDSYAKHFSFIHQQKEE